MWKIFATGTAEEVIQAVDRAVRPLGGKAEAQFERARQYLLAELRDHEVFYGVRKVCAQAEQTETGFTASVAEVKPAKVAKVDEVKKPVVAPLPVVGAPFDS